MRSYTTPATPASAAPAGEPADQAHRERVRAIEDAILKAEGVFHVGGRYVADLEDASRQRRRAAERIAREVERVARDALTAAGRRLLAG